MLRLSVLFFFLISSQTIFGQIVAPGQFGNELRQSLRDQYGPTHNWDYAEARHEMFTNIDNQDGVVRLVYTGKEIETRVVPKHTWVNTEHTWPRSKFGRGRNRRMMNADINHLFPTFNKVNSSRGSLPFGDIPDRRTEKWWISSEAEEGGIPPQNLDQYSEWINSKFEPREDHKGNVARAMFYFFTMYETSNIDKDWFRSQVEDLVAWHEADPADEYEQSRALKVEEVQGNLNPFIFDSTLVRRAFVRRGTDGPIQPFSIFAGRTPAAMERLATAGADSHERENSADADTLKVCTWNLYWFFDENDADNESRLAIGKTARNSRIYARRVKETAGVLAEINADVMALQEVENRKVVRDLANELASQYGLNFRVAFKQGYDDYTEQDVAFLVRNNIEFTASRFEFPDELRSNRRFKDVSKHCCLKFEVNGESFVLVNVHLITDTGKRMKQARTLHQWTKEIAQTSNLVVTGDFNIHLRYEATRNGTDISMIRGLDSSAQEDDLEDLHKYLDREDRGTWRTGSHLDRFLVSKPLVDASGYRVVKIANRQDISGDASDHYPLVASFAMSGEIDGGGRRLSSDSGSLPVRINEAEMSDLVAELRSRMTESSQPTDASDIQRLIGGELDATDSSDQLESTIQIGTYNLEYLGKKRKDYAGRERPLRSLDELTEIADRVSSELDLEVIVFQEINTESDNWKVLKKLLADRGYSFFEGKHSSRNQFVVLAWDSSEVEVDESSLQELDVATEFELGDGCVVDGQRKPLAGKFKAGNFDFWAVGVHLKSRVGERCAKKARKKQCEELIEQVDELIASSGERDVVIAGDFNNLIGHKSLTPISDGDFIFQTKFLADATGRGTYLKTSSPHKSKDLIDHIAIRYYDTQEVVRNSTTVYSFGSKAEALDYVIRQSDHAPVWTSFSTEVDLDDE